MKHPASPILALLVLACLIPAHLAAQEADSPAASPPAAASPATDAPPPAAIAPATAPASPAQKVLATDLWDLALAGSGAALALGSEFLLPVNLLDASTANLSVDDIPEFDALFMTSYNAGAATASDIAQVAAALSPALWLLTGQENEWFDLGVVSAEALGWTFGLKNLVKYLVPRVRPYVYLDGVPGDSGRLAEANESFLSGHTALAFCGASLLTTLCAELSPDHPATPWIVGGSWAAAVTTAALRLASGEHFATDVIAGALLGSLVGFSVAEIHIRPPKASLDSSPAQLTGPDNPTTATGQAAAPAATPDQPGSGFTSLTLRPGYGSLILSFD